jgi:hypothetical protein
VKKKQRIKPTKNVEYKLLEEVSNCCPMCSTSLFREGKKRISKIYEVAHIYPHSPTESQIHILKDVKQPDDIESPNNLIALCRNCHKIYDETLSVESYVEMVKLKNTLQARYEAKNRLSAISIEKEIKAVLGAMKNISSEEIRDLTMKPVLVSQKIPESEFQNKIKSYVTNYFVFLQKQFQELDAVNSGLFKRIASTVRNAFEHAENVDFFKQEETFDELVGWLKRQTNGTTSACECVISFFIQDCEVFHAVSK